MPENSPQLLVEGKDDESFIRGLLRRRGFVSNGDKLVKGEKIVTIVDMKGFDKLITGVSTYLKPGDPILGIVFDLDQPNDRRWERLRGSLVRLRYEGLPERLPGEGLVHLSQGELPSVGVWGMPDNQGAGSLEDLVLRSVAEQANEGVQHAGQVIAELPPAVKKFSDRKVSKATFHTWLAWQEEPGMKMDVAIAKGLIDVETATPSRLGDWIERWLA